MKKIKSKLSSKQSFSLRLFWFGLSTFLCVNFSLAENQTINLGGVPGVDANLHVNDLSENLIKSQSKTGEGLFDAKSNVKLCDSVMAETSEREIDVKYVNKDSETKNNVNKCVDLSSDGKFGDSNHGKVKFKDQVNDEKVKPVYVNEATVNFIVKETSGTDFYDNRSVNQLFETMHDGRIDAFGKSMEKDGSYFLGDNKMKQNGIGQIRGFKNRDFENLDQFEQLGKDIDRKMKKRDVGNAVSNATINKLLNHVAHDYDINNNAANDSVTLNNDNASSNIGIEVFYARNAEEEPLDYSQISTDLPDQEECVGDSAYCNYTMEEYIEMLNEYIFPQPYEWVLIASHAFVFFVGLVGNALVCVAVYRNHSMRTVTNYFIVNLAVADFMVILFCLPPTVLWDVTETWFFGNAMCRIVLYFQSVSVSVSVLTLTFISVDRWYAICFPLKFKSTTSRAKTAIIVIWLISLVFNSPEFIVLQTERSSRIRFGLDYFTQCTPTWSLDSDLKWHIIKAVFLYTLPLLLMTIAYCQIVRVLWKSDNIPGHCESHKYTTTAPQNCKYGMSNRRQNTMSAHANASTEGQLRSRRKAAKMLVAVVIMFAVCYFPVHLISILRYAFGIQQSEFIAIMALLSHWLCYANSAVNPLIYNFMSGKFRREFRRSFFKCSCLGLSPGPASDSRAGLAAGGGPRRGGPGGAGTRRSESCASYRLAHLSPSSYATGTTMAPRDYPRGNTHTSFIENNNSSGRKAGRSDSTDSTATTRLVVSTDQ